MPPKQPPLFQEDKDAAQSQPTLPAVSGEFPELVNYQTQFTTVSGQFQTSLHNLSGQFDLLTSPMLDASLKYQTALTELNNSTSQGTAAPLLTKLRKQREVEESKTKLDESMRHVQELLNCLSDITGSEESKASYQSTIRQQSKLISSLNDNIATLANINATLQREQVAKLLEIDAQRRNELNEMESKFQNQLKQTMQRSLDELRAEQDKHLTALRNEMQANFQLQQTNESMQKALDQLQAELDCTHNLYQGFAQPLCTLPGQIQPRFKLRYPPCIEHNSLNQLLYLNNADLTTLHQYMKQTAELIWGPNSSFTDLEEKWQHARQVLLSILANKGCIHLLQIPSPLTRDAQEKANQRSPSELTPDARNQALECCKNDAIRQCLMSGVSIDHINHVNSVLSRMLVLQLLGFHSESWESLPDTAKFSDLHPSPQSLLDSLLSDTVIIAHHYGSNISSLSASTMAQMFNMIQQYGDVVPDGMELFCAQFSLPNFPRFGKDPHTMALVYTNAYLNTIFEMELGKTSPAQLQLLQSYSFIDHKYARPGDNNGFGAFGQTHGGFGGFGSGQPQSGFGSGQPQSGFGFGQPQGDSGRTNSVPSYIDPGNDLYRESIYENNQNLGSVLGFIHQRTNEVWSTKKSTTIDEKMYVIRNTIVSLLVEPTYVQLLSVLAFPGKPPQYGRPKLPVDQLPTLKDLEHASSKCSSQGDQLASMLVDVNSRNFLVAQYNIFKLCNLPHHVVQSQPHSSSDVFLNCVQLTSFNHSYHIPQFGEYSLQSPLASSPSAVESMLSMISNIPDSYSTHPVYQALTEVQTKLNNFKEKLATPVNLHFNISQ